MTIDPSLLLPRPRAVQARDGVFSLSAATSIAIAAQPSESVLRGAKLLQGAIDEVLGFAPAIVPGGSRTGAIELRLGDTDDQAYAIEIAPDRLIVRAESEAGLFYGVQTLIQIIRLYGRVLPAASIDDRPVLPVRGFMLDVSRGRVPKLESLKDLVHTLAHYKFNHLQLYVEHTFAFPRHPSIGANAGALTPEDILELDLICREHHIELAPNLQSVGHMAALLKQPQYSQLAETAWNWSLATANEGTFTLTDELYGDFLPAFSSKLFNVGADEPWDMGRGQSKELTARIGIGRVYLEHVLRLDQLARKHGRRTAIWADVLTHHPEVILDLPEDMLLLDWSYEATATYPSLQALSTSGREFWICPATSSWTALFPRMENAVANIQDYVKQGVAAGCTGMLLTEWGDGGHYQLPGNSWYLYLWGAENGWNGGDADRDRFDRAFDRLFLADGSGAVTAALRRLGETTQNAPYWLTSWNTAMALLEEPITGTLSEKVDAGTVLATRDAVEALLPLLDRIRDREIRHDLSLTIALIRFATEKVELNRALRAALVTGSPDELGQLTEQLSAQRALLPVLVHEFAARWRAHARESELRINLDRFAALQERYDKALEWLRGNRETPYDASGYAVLHDATKLWVESLRDIVGFDALPRDLQEWLNAAE